VLSSSKRIPKLNSNLDALDSYILLKSTSFPKLIRSRVLSLTVILINIAMKKIEINDKKKDDKKAGGKRAPK
jgi:hypothetical protein